MQTGLNVALRRIGSGGLSAFVGRVDSCWMYDLAPHSTQLFCHPLDISAAGESESNDGGRPVENPAKFRIAG